MDEFEIVTTVERAPAEVFAALQDLEKIPLWNSTLSEVRKTSEGPLGLGSTVVYVGRFLGRSYESPAEYTEYDPDKAFTSKTTAGPFDLEVTSRLEDTGGMTKLTIHARGESHGFFKIAEPIVVRLTKRAFENAYDNLKTLLEAGALQ
jgi:uncharacterized protein YndB with AHSA1/START domain